LVKKNFTQTETETNISFFVSDFRQIKREKERENFRKQYNCHFIQL